LANLIVDLLSRLLNERGVLLADGATGSNLFGAGLQTGDSPELWNDIHPDRIANQYQGFIDAGSDIILTNTFGGTRYRLGLHDAAHRVHELNVKAAQIARNQVDAAGREIIVGGSMGPTGEILEPLGSLSVEAAAEAFAEQANALKEGGVDVLWIETISSREEATAAVMGASQAGLPVVATFSVDTNGRTMMGLTPADIVGLSLEMDNAPFAIGANCGIGASDLVAAIVNMQSEISQRGVEMIVIAKANCGVPEYIDGKIVYSGTEQIMADYIRLAMDAGATIIGGCCGTTPAHVRAMRDALDHHSKGQSPGLETIESTLGKISSGARAQLGGDLSIAGGALREPGERRSRRRSRKA
jgi:5-methyltetrahydrofolate--homocysteine methyltransferase